MEYDSDYSQLSFFKCNDKKLNSKIVNLPKNTTFYWIIGHERMQLSVTVVNDNISNKSYNE